MTITKAQCGKHRWYDDDCMTLVEALIDQRLDLEWPSASRHANPQVTITYEEISDWLKKTSKTFIHISYINYHQWHKLFLRYHARGWTVAKDYSKGALVFS